MIPNTQPNRDKATAGRTDASQEPIVIPPMAIKAREAFERDLPRLLQERPRQWVAYHGDKQVGFAKNDLSLYQECARRGIGLDEFLVFPIEPGADVWDVYMGLRG